MKHNLTILFVTVFILSMSISSWANCFNRSHRDRDHSHRQEISAEAHQHEAHHHDEDSSRIHCIENHFAIGALRSISKTDFNSKLLPAHFFSDLDPAVARNSFHDGHPLIHHSTGFPPYSLQAGSSPHLFFSVLQV